mmetsp:Transcript_46528/g.92493  ORF Transcript_46528/g.92493 Transcript_46528/m.92493 type:complete len:231 (+) Transcript_46528:372-1064(+)
MPRDLSFNAARWSSWRLQSGRVSHRALSKRRSGPGSSDAWSQAAPLSIQDRPWTPSSHSCNDASASAAKGFSPATRSRSFRPAAMARSSATMSLMPTDDNFLSAAASSDGDHNLCDSQSVSTSEQRCCRRSDVSCCCDTRLSGEPALLQLEPGLETAAATSDAAAANQASSARASRPARSGSQKGRSPESWIRCRSVGPARSSSTNRGRLRMPRLANSRSAATRRTALLG